MCRPFLSAGLGALVVTAASASCLPDAVPQEQWRNMFFGGQVMPIGVWYNRWDSAEIIAHIVVILMTEAMGWNASISGSGPGTENSIHALAGCRDGKDCLKDPSLDDGFPPKHHFAFEGWWYQESLESWTRTKSERAPVRLHLTGFVGSYGTYVNAHSLNAALQQPGFNLDWYRSYDASLNPEQFFSSINHIDLQNLTECKLSTRDLVRYHHHFPSDPLVYTSDGTSYHMTCQNQKWWIAPACRSDTSRCIPYIDYFGWGIPTLIQKATYWNMPLAIASATTLSSWRYIVQHQNVLTYWWQPDASLLKASVNNNLLLMQFPIVNETQHQQGFTVTSDPDVFVHNFAAQGVDVAAHSAYQFAANVHLELHMAVTFLKELVLNGSHTHYSVACSWLHQNKHIWEVWLPDNLACLPGQGIVNKSGDPVYSLESATHCDWCPLGRHSYHTGVARNTPRICGSCPAGKFQNDLGRSECHDCKPGRYSNTSAKACHQCPVGSFTDKHGSSSCTRCNVLLSGASTHLAGSSSQESCFQCAPGQYYAGLEPCRPCRKGTFSNDFGALECEECPTGQSTYNVGAVRCNYLPVYVASCFAAFSMLTTASILLSLSLRRFLPVEDITTKDGVTILTTINDHWIAKGDGCIRVWLTGQKNRRHPGAYRARIRSSRTMELLGLDGKSPSRAIESASGSLRMAFPMDVAYTGYRFVRVGMIVVAFPAAALLLMLCTDTPWKDALYVCLASVFIGAVTVLFRWRRSHRPSQVTDAVVSFKSELYRRNCHGITNMGPERGVSLGKIWELLDEFRPYIRDRQMLFVVNEFVKPITEEMRCSYAEVVGGSMIEWFVSHCWTDGFADFAMSLRTHAEQVAVTGERTWRDIPYWACSLSINQWNVVHELGMHWSETSFFLALHSPTCKGTVMVIQETAAPLTRSWCLFETMQTFLIKQGRDSDFHGLFLATRAGVLNNGTAPIDVLLKIAEKISHVFFEEAQATQMEDKIMIDKAVQTHAGGFRAVNQFVRDHIRQAVTTGKQKLETKISVVVSALGITSRNAHFGIPSDPLGNFSRLSLLPGADLAIESAFWDEDPEDDRPERPHASTGTLVKGAKDDLEEDFASSAVKLKKFERKMTMKPATIEELTEAEATEAEERLSTASEAPSIVAS